jgi:NAD-dependent deacetylase
VLDAVAEQLRTAKSLLVLTGAGVSAESGIATFRDALTGLWSNFKAEDLATPEGFANDPVMVTRWYDERRTRCAACQPNPGHQALAALERYYLDNGRKFLLLTQNVDRLHQRAGSRDVVELHGTLWVWRCVRCDKETEELTVPFATHPPRCACGGMRRPGVVWFGEMLPMHALARAHEALESCDVFLSLGTSAVVEPAASFAFSAKRNGATTIEINLDPTPISATVDYTLRAKTGEILPKILERLA